MCIDTGAPHPQRFIYVHSRTHTHVQNFRQLNAQVKNEVQVRQYLFIVEGPFIFSRNTDGSLICGNPLAELPHGQRQNADLPSLW